MAKVFTITEGLDNLGAMKTGGQGSVYKGRRIGEIITAIKLLPTPIYNESMEDKSFADFQNEVQKLKKVNENPNPNVVKILSSGVSDTGNFPFIEMEFIEGPDLEELLKPPHAPVFTIKEALKVADQLSHALAHCHKLEVRHGDIKSNNVKFNIHTGNYVLLDFGLAVMSDEQRRSSLRHAGAIEFMAPEQNEGQMLFQTDVYSFGIILFELLAGTVPFPLHDKGETARNTVRLLHMETPPPDLIPLRKKAVAATDWDEEKKEHEMNVPDWLITMVYKCLEKKPENRFLNGVELNEYIVLNSILTTKKEEDGVEQSDILREQHKKLLAEKEQLEKVLVRYKQEIGTKDKELSELKAIAEHKSGEEHLLKQNNSYHTQASGGAYKTVSKGAFMSLLLLTIALVAVCAYSVFKQTNTVAPQISSSNNSIADTTPTNTYNTSQTEVKHTKAPTKTVPQKPIEVTHAITNKTPSQADKNREKIKNVQERDDQNVLKPGKASGKYKVISTAYFYNKPNESTRRNAFVNHWNQDILTPLDDQNGFIYIVYKNEKGQVSKGWLRKKDLKQVR